MRRLSLGRSETAAVLVILLAAVVVCLKPGQWNGRLLHGPEEVDSLAPLPEAGPDSARGPATDKAPLLPFGYPTAAEAARFVRTVADTIRRNDSVYASLSRNGLGPQSIRRLIDEFGRVFNLRRSLPGDFYWCGLDGAGSVRKFSYWGRKYLNEDRPVYFTVEAVDSLLSARQVAIPITVSIHGLSGEVRSSLYTSIVSLGEKPPLDWQFTEIFAWDLDFNIDPRTGDSFKMVFEKVYVDDKFVRYGRILAASYAGERDTLLAVYYRNPNREEGYFDRKGRPFRKTFLKSPLHYRRISSRFSNRRFHPIYRIYRPHHGVDYSAPVGTPVRSTAAGKVVGIGYKGDNGRYLKIKHRSNIYTWYLHLSGYGPGVRFGADIEQGQTIGYVGATGAATGPHLDYRLSRNGRFVNPVNQTFPSAPPVGAEFIADFQAIASGMERALDRISSLGVAPLQLDRYAD